MEIPRHDNPPDLELLAEYFKCSSQNVIYLNFFQGHFGLSAKQPHVVDDSRGPIHMTVNFLRQCIEDFFLDGFFAINFFHKKTAGGFDDRKRLIQLMRHARCHLSQRCHFTGLNDLLFCLKPLGIITGGQQQNLFPAIFRRRNPNIYKKGFARFIDLFDAV